MNAHETTGRPMGRPKIESDPAMRARDSRWLVQTLIFGEAIDGIAADDQVSPRTVARGIARAQARANTVANGGRLFTE